MNASSGKVVVLVGEGGDVERAQALADRFDVPFVDTGRSTGEGAHDVVCDVRAMLGGTVGEGMGSRLALRLDVEGLTLTDGTLELRGDFTRMLTRIRPGAVQREFVVKAAKVKPCRSTAAVPGDAPTRPLVVDATAGLGEDSLLLAAAGFDVVLYEHNPVIAALLDDALHRAARAGDPVLADAVSHMRLVEGDSVAALKLMANAAWEADAEYVPDAPDIPDAARVSDAPDAPLAAAACEATQLFVPDRVPDVVLLDPMFPERRKSASVKKKLQMLQRLEVPCADEETLLEAALAAHPRKVVIKRPPKGPHLAGVKPSYSLAGKAVRYDCIVVPERAGGS